MKALLCYQWGGPSSLVIEDIPAVTPRAGEVRIAVRACSVNFADGLLIQGLYQTKPSFPFSPGLEAAGEVLEVGQGVEAFRRGDRLIAVPGQDGMAEELTVAETNCLRMPDEMDYETASTFAIAYGTAYLGLLHRAALQSGETLLVHGASGGTGLAAVEVGKLMGATVIATGSTSEKLALAEKYGADHLINYTESDFRRRVKQLTDDRGADVIYDPVGGDVFDQSLRCINWEGRLIVVGFASGRIPHAVANIVLLKSLSIMGVYFGGATERDPELIEKTFAQLFEWYGDGKLKPHVSRTYPLAQAPDAIRNVMNRKALGRQVITMGQT